jgi:hypothetical protein
MGLEKEPPSKKSKLPPIFTGEAIEIRFPDVIVNNKKQEFNIITFPDWAHKVYVDDQIHEVLGKDLEIGMAFTIDGMFIPIIDINKSVLYHGMQIQNLKIGEPCDSSSIERKKFKRCFKEDGTQYWEISTIKGSTN